MTQVPFNVVNICEGCASEIVGPAVVFLRAGATLDAAAYHPEHAPDDGDAGPDGGGIGMRLDVADIRELIKSPLGKKKPGRNDPCPCGSGQKYKRCHGG